MADVDEQERSEQPTHKRLSDGREKGKVAKSIEINSFAIFTTGLLMVYITQKFLSSQISEYSIHIFSSIDVLKVNKDLLQNYAKEGLYFYLITLAPILGALFLIALITGFAQVGFKFTLKPLMPDFNKFNPINGIKKVIISTRSIVEVLKSLLKLLIIGGFTYSILSQLVLNSTKLAELTIPEIVSFMVDSAYALLWKIALVYAAIAAVDFIYQKFKFKKEMMMTKQEVKDENKQSEGDPLIKQRIKKAQFQAAKNRMMKNVPKADVIITNPTHFAVALKYDITKDTAPKVLAKGVDELAQRIKAIAAENGVPIHEDRELARAIYRICNIGDEIPAQLFKAVAQVLAYVYQLKNRKKKKSIV